MLVSVTVCQAERNVDKKEGEREKMRQEKGQDTSFTYLPVPVGYKRAFSVV